MCGVKLESDDNEQVSTLGSKYEFEVFCNIFFKNESALYCFASKKIIGYHIKSLQKLILTCFHKTVSHFPFNIPMSSSEICGCEMN